VAQVLKGGPTTLLYLLNHLPWRPPALAWNHSANAARKHYCRVSPQHQIIVLVPPVQASLINISLSRVLRHFSLYFDRYDSSPAFYIKQVILSLLTHLLTSFLSNNKNRTEIKKVVRSSHHERNRLSIPTAARNSPATPGSTLIDRKNNTHIFKLKIG
jgi:hypothetical protein